jgi:hypothetical protein
VVGEQDGRYEASLFCRPGGSSNRFGSLAQDRENTLAHKKLWRWRPVISRQHCNRCMWSSDFVTVEAEMPISSAAARIETIRILLHVLDLTTAFFKDGKDSGRA